MNDEDRRAITGPVVGYAAAVVALIILLVV